MIPKDCEIEVANAQYGFQVIVLSTDSNIFAALFCTFQGPDQTLIEVSNRQNHLTFYGYHFNYILKDENRL